MSTLQATIIVTFICNSPAEHLNDLYFLVKYLQTILKITCVHGSLVTQLKIYPNTAYICIV